MVWEVGDPIGTGDDIGAPEVPYMSYGPRRVESDEESDEERRKREEEEEEERKIRELEFTAIDLQTEALSLYDEERYEEALIFINRSLEYWEMLRSWTLKARILERLNRFEEALKAYDLVIEENSSDIHKHNKAVGLIRYAYFLKDKWDNEKGFEKIKESLEIFQDIDDKTCEDEAWNLKGIFLERSNEIPDAFNCYKRAYGLAVNEEQKKTYMNNRNNLIRYIENRFIHCPNCGQRLKITANNCFKCGAPIDESVEIVLKNIEGNMKFEEHSCGATILHFDED